MKKNHSDVKQVFTLLIVVSVLAIAVGAYLGVALGMQVQASVTLLSAAGIILWSLAWGAFALLCLRLRKGESAFTPATGKTLRIILWCMVGLAAVTVLSAFIGLDRTNTAAPAVGLVLLPGVFLSAAVAASVLRGLLLRAMSIEKEQEGTV